LGEILRVVRPEIIGPEDGCEEFVGEARLDLWANIPPHLPRDGSMSRRSQNSRDVLLAHFQTQSLRGFGCEEYTAGLDACALVLRYLQETQVNALPHIRALSTYSAR